MTPAHGEATGRDGGDTTDGTTTRLTGRSDKPAVTRRRRPRLMLDWSAILDAAAPLVSSELHKVGIPPTLRRVHYLLVSDPAARELGYVNTENCYKNLSRRTTAGRDAGTFPQLADQTRSIEYASGYSSPAGLLHNLARGYRLDREQYLDRRVILIAEKAGVVPLLTSRYGWLTMTSTRGYASVSHARDIAALADHRPALALYIGDYDPTGLDIDRALTARLPFPLERVALNADQVTAHDLPPVPAKDTDSRSAAMLRDQGHAVQVELDALPTDALFGIVDTALTELAGVPIRADGMPDWPDVDAREQAQREWLRDVAATAGDAS